MKSFPEKLKEARARMNMSQEELGNKIEVSRRSVLSYEKGEKFPRDRVIYRIAAVLGVSVKYLKDENCDDPMEDIELDRHISAVFIDLPHGSQIAVENAFTFFFNKTIHSFPNKVVVV